jgi:hypothetical protein
MIILIFTLLSLIATTQKCNHYTCDVDNTGVANDSWVCMNSTMDPTTRSLNIKLSKLGCPINMVCDYSFSESNDTCISYIPKSLAPGEYCTQNGQCYSNNCNNGKCVGNQVDVDCVFDIECDYGMACGASKCAPLVKLGGACDNMATKCSPKLTCNLGVCTNIGSLANYVAADSPLACQSFYIAPQSAGSTTYVCNPGPNLVGGMKDGNLTKCPESGSCVYSTKLKDNTVVNSTSMCDCGRNSQDTLYCQLGKGDLVNETKLYLAFAANATIPACQISKGMFCNSLKWDNTTYMAYSAFMNLTQQTLYDSRESCIMKINEAYFKGASIYWDFIQYRNDTPIPDAAFIGAKPISLWGMAIVVMAMALI